MLQGNPIYSEELVEKFCTYLEEGLSLREIAKIKGMPCTRTVYNWIAKKEGFKDRYVAAKEQGLVKMAEDIVDIADSAKADGVAKARLQIDSRKWILSKLLPKKYGDRLETKTTIGLEDELYDLLDNTTGPTEEIE